MDIRNHGERNTIQVAASVRGILEIRGHDNFISIGEPLASAHVHVSLGSRNRVSIGSNCVLGNLFVHANDGATVQIGSSVGFNGLVRLLLHEARSIAIGDQCLFAADTDVSVSDMHSIVDAATGKRVNAAKDIIIGRHVWIGTRCLVLKGARIDSGSIIGAASVVTTHVPAETLAFGVPATVRKTGVTWRHELLPIADDE